MCVCICVCVCVLFLVIQSYLTLCDPIDYSPPGFSVHGDSPGKNTRVGCHALLQGDHLNLGLNVCLQHLLHWQVSWFLIPITLRTRWYFSIKPCVPSLKSGDKKL